MKRTLTFVWPIHIIGFLLAAQVCWGQGDHHGDLRHWEEASLDPDRIILTFCEDPATSRSVTWRTSDQVQSTQAEIARATDGPGFTKFKRTVKAKTEPLDLNIADVNSQGKVNYHSVTFRDLEPETQYLYRVMGAKDRWSEWMSFRTAADRAEPFRFVYFGDAQNEVLDHWSRVIRKAYEYAPDAAFALYCGDLINHAHHDQEWAEWYKAGGWIHGHQTAIPVMGNHERGPYESEKGPGRGWWNSLQWRPQFTLPEEPSLPEKVQETVYTIDYQGMRIIVLNSLQEIEAQTDYLEKQLQRPGAQWTVVATHYSLFSPRAGRDYEKQRNAWKPLLDKYGVDLVLQGHDHVYARGYVPERSIDGGYKDDFQTLYVTSVSGPKMYKIGENKLENYKEDGYVEGKTAEKTQFFQVITVDEGRLVYEAFTATGQLYDKVEIEKDFSTGKKRMF